MRLGETCPTAKQKRSQRIEIARLIVEERAEQDQSLTLILKPYSNSTALFMGGNCSFNDFSISARSCKHSCQHQQVWEAPAGVGGVAGASRPCR